MRIPFSKLTAVSIIPVLFLLGCAEKVNPSATPEAEAARLYQRADAYIKSVSEGNYSYNYIQFYWQRAEANFERIDRTYGETPTARQLRNGELKAGPYEISYFKERVLPRLEVKKLAAFKVVNCAIFLYNLPENKQSTPARKETLRWIIERLCREDRFPEALGVPVIEEERPILLSTVVRIAALYQKAPLPFINALFKDLPDEEKTTLRPVIAEALAFRGETSEQLNKYLSDNGDTEDLRIAVLKGLIRREVAIERALAEKMPLKNAFDGVDGIQNPDVRINPKEYASIKLVESPAKAAGVFEGYSNEQVSKDPLHKIYELARLGKTKAAQQLQQEVAQKDPSLAEPSVYQLVRGQMSSFVTKFAVQPDTFSALPLKDPNLMAQLILEWSLTPNINQRGMQPWDSIVFKFAPAFDNLPPPEADATPVSKT